MAFKIALTPTYKQKVEVEIPNERGSYDKSDFMAEFKRYTVDQLEELRKKPQREVISEALVGWSGLIDGDDKDVPFSAVSKEALMRIPEALLALVDIFWSSVFKAREKNS